MKRYNEFINESEKNWNDELISASMDGDLNGVKQSIKNGADVDHKYGNSLHTPLIVASTNGYLKVIKYLVDHGADIHMTNRNGKTALHYAKSNRCQNIIDYLEEVIEGPFEQFEDWEDIDENMNHKFQVGDEVKIKETSVHYGEPWQMPISSTGIITIASNSSYYPYRVEWGDGGKHGKNYNVYEEEDLELVEDEPFEQFEDWEDIDEEYDHVNARFEIGDKVKIIGNTYDIGDYLNSYHSFEIGSVCEIIRIHFNGNCDVFGGGKRQEIYDKDLELIDDEPFEQFEDWDDELNEAKKDLGGELLRAAEYGYLDIVKQLINGGVVVDVNIQDKDGNTALIYASAHGRLDVVKYISESLFPSNDKIVTKIKR